MSIIRLVRDPDPDLDFCSDHDFDHDFDHDIGSDNGPDRKHEGLPRCGRTTPSRPVPGVPRSGSLRFLPLLVLALASLPPFGGCGKDKGPSQPHSNNAAPVVTPIHVANTRVLTHMRVTLSVSAHDPDDTILRYTWEASAGVFPLGNTGSGMTWLSPDEPGPDTLTVSVDDSHQIVRVNTVIQVQPMAPPADLVAAAGSSIADLQWTESPDHRLDAWSGYEVYVSTRSFDAIPAESLSAYRIPGPIPDPFFRAAGLERGTIYHFRVGALRSWTEGGERSPLTAEVELSPRPEWIQQMSEIRNPGGGLAVDLSAGEVRPIDPADATGLWVRDLYFGTSDPLDGPGSAAEPATPRLKSVSLLSNRNPAWASHRVWIKPLGTDWAVDTVTDEGWLEEVDLQPQAVYAVKTSEGNFAKILVADLIAVASPYRQLTLRWAFQTIPGYRRF